MSDKSRNNYYINNKQFYSFYYEQLAAQYDTKQETEEGSVIRPGLVEVCLSVEELQLSSFSSPTTLLVSSDSLFFFISLRSVDTAYHYTILCYTKTSLI